MNTWQDWGAAAGYVVLFWNITDWLVQQYLDHRADRPGKGWQ